MKKIFILTGEPSGDKLASKVIKEFKKDNSEIEYLSVGGENLEALGIKSIYDLKEITYIGFTNVIKNIFKINKKIWLNNFLDATKNKNVDLIIELIGGAEGPAKKLVFNALHNPNRKTRYAITPSRMMYWTLPMLLPDRILDRLIKSRSG